MMPKSSDIDLTPLSEEQILSGMGDLLLGMLTSHKVALAVLSPEGAVTFLNPLICRSIPPEALAAQLLESWSEDEVATVLEHIYG